MRSKPIYRWLLLFCCQCFLPVLLGAPAKPDETDIFFTNHTIHRLRIELDTNAMAALRNKYREYVKATVSEGDLTNYNVGIHLKGQYGTFQGIDGRPSLTLNFDKFVKGQSFHGLDKFHLNNSAQDRSYLCEIIGREMFQGGGVPTPRATHARVELNGRDLGLFVLVEGTDKSFLKRHFKSPNGNLYDSGFRHDIADAIEKKSGEGPDDHSDLHALLTASREPNHAIRLEKLSRILDMDRFYRMLALELTARHFDGYAVSLNNYRIYFDPAMQKAVFLPHGMDQLFHQAQAPLLPDLRGTLATAVLQTQSGRREFRSWCASFYTNLFPHLTNRIEAARMRIRPTFAELGTEAALKHDQAVTNLQRRLRERIEHLALELSDAFVTRPEFRQTNTVSLTNWLLSAEQGRAMLVRTNVSGQEAFEIRAAPGTEGFSGKWQGRVFLPAGLYALSTRVTASEPVFRGPQCPVSIRAWGMDEAQVETIRKDSRTMDLRYSFEIQSPAFDEVVIEYQVKGTRSSQSYSVNAIHLTRLP